MSAKPECNAVMTSAIVPNHVHSCTGRHLPLEDHYCTECQRWWYQA